MSNLDIKEKSIQTMSSVVCPICHKVFKSQRSMTNHKAWHNRPPTFRSQTTESKLLMRLFRLWLDGSIDDASFETALDKLEKS